MIRIEIFRTDLDEERDVGSYRAYMYLPSREHGGYEEWSAEIAEHNRADGWRPLVMAVIEALERST